MVTVSLVLRQYGGAVEVRYVRPLCVDGLAEQSFEVGAFGK